MYEVIAYQRFFETITDDDDEGEEKEGMRWLIVCREFKLPFVPVSDMNIRFPDEPDYGVADVVWDMEYMSFVVYGYSVSFSQINYEESLHGILEHTGWEFVEDENSEHKLSPGDSNNNMVN